MTHRLAALALAGALLGAGAAAASPADYPACTSVASDTGALSDCTDFRADLSACSGLTGSRAPVDCMESRLDAWDARLAAEEARAVEAGLREPGSLDDWREAIVARCRDPEEARLSAERYGEAHAAFTAARCELRATLRRLVETTARLRGFE
jgi:hypothetical protein